MRETQSDLLTEPADRIQFLLGVFSHLMDLNLHDCFRCVILNLVHDGADIERVLFENWTSAEYYFTRLEVSR